MTLTATVAKDKRGEWRWTIHSRNGRIVGASSEGYKNRGMCLRNLELVTARKTDVSRKNGALKMRAMNHPFKWLVE